MDNGWAFRLTMPEAYRTDFDDAAAAEHGRIVNGRQGALVHVEACTDARTPWICVVTDDCPGLLSLVCVAISAHGLDVKDARIYCRSRAPDVREAVDFFAVQPARGSKIFRLGEENMRAIRESIEDLVGKDPDIESFARRSTPTSRFRPKLTFASEQAAPIAKAWFLADRDRDVLVVETEDRPNLLLAITLGLYRRRLNIVRSNVATLGTRARDDFEVSEFDGGRVSEPRKLAAVGAIVAAIGRVANDQPP
jgi:[protein-PII] uridylyltransferase